MRCFKSFFLTSIVLVSVYYSGCSKSPTTPEKPNTPTIISFTATPSIIKSNESSILSWNVANATFVFIDHGIGDVEPNGSKEVSPAETTTYTLGATLGLVTVVKTCTITVDASNLYLRQRKGLIF